MKRSVVLLSSGMDSTVNLYAAKKNSRVLLALTFDYGQKAAARECASARKLAKKLKIPHKVVKLSFFQEFQGSSLLNRKKKVPEGKQISIDSFAVSKKTAASVWVPNRNGIFLNIAAGFAENLKADWIIPGFNKEEATTFPDNSGAFLKSLDQALRFSTSHQIQAKCFTTKLSKTQIVKLGEKLKVDWSLMWPCYLQGKKWCGRCESCQRSKRALMAAKIPARRLKF